MFFVLPAQLCRIDISSGSRFGARHHFFIVLPVSSYTLHRVCRKSHLFTDSMVTQKKTNVNKSLSLYTTIFCYLFNISRDFCPFFTHIHSLNCTFLGIFLNYEPCKIAAIDRLPFYFPVMKNDSTFYSK